MIKDNWTIVRIFKTSLVCNFYVSRVTGLTTPRSAPVHIHSLLRQHQELCNILFQPFGI